MGLQINPEPIKIVPAGVREVWTRQPPRRCYYEDGRGRCSSYDTKIVWIPEEHAPRGGFYEYRCEKHLEEEK